MKRFYTAASTTPADAGYGILLDGRAIKTPKRAALVVPTAHLAEAIAAEWQEQGEDIRPDTMPLTGMANAAIDLISPDLVSFVSPLAAYADSDLLCYRAPDAALSAHEAALWNPILAWAEQRYAVEFLLVTGIMHQRQADATFTALGDAVMAYDAFRIAALSPLITIGGSLVAALALAERAFDRDTLWAAVNCNELWQEQKWGTDAEAIAARAAKKREWDAAARFLELLDA